LYPWNEENPYQFKNKGCEVRKYTDEKCEEYVMVMTVLGRVWITIHHLLYHSLVRSALYSARVTVRHSDSVSVDATAASKMGHAKR
jgi:hypothetical protein